MIVTRRGYGGRGLDRVFPLDAELNLPPDKYSHGLREVLVEEVVRVSFDEAAVQLSEDFDAFYDQPLAPSHAVRDAGKILGISADGKGMVMQPNGRREATRRALARQEHTQHTRLSPGEKKNRRRMATVVSLYEVDPYPRTAEQILDLEQPPDGRRPRPSNQRTWARVQADQGTVLEQSSSCPLSGVHKEIREMNFWVAASCAFGPALRMIGLRLDGVMPGSLNDHADAVRSSAWLAVENGRGPEHTNGAG